MTGRPEPLRALLFQDDDALARSVTAVAERAGFEVTAVVGGVVDAVRASVAAHPDVVVLDVEASGALGLGVLPVLQAAAPQTVVVVLSSFEGLEVAAREAGAYEVVGTRDLRALDRCLRRLRAEAAVGSAGQ